MSLIRRIAVCELTDMYFYAESQGIETWNGIQDVIFRTMDREHRHFHLEVFVVTPNFFNPDYLDDAYGLRWDERVRRMVQGYMKSNRLKKVAVVTGKNHSLLEL